MAGLYVGALAVAVVQLVRSRDRRLIPLLVMLALLAASHARGLSDRWTTAAHAGAALAGFALALVVPPRPGR
jgi:hypothetical protein